MSPVDVLKTAGDHGLTLRINGEKLRVLPAERLSPDFAEVLKAHKPALLALLKLPFVQVYSEAVEEVMFFCQDEPTKAALVAAGAEEWSIYTKDELRTLSEQNRVAPLTAAELRRVHEIKRTFCGRITTHRGDGKRFVAHVDEKLTAFVEQKA
jgi:hypothetical protein